MSSDAAVNVYLWLERPVFLSSLSLTDFELGFWKRPFGSSHAARRSKTTSETRASDACGGVRRSHSLALPRRGQIRDSRKAQSGGQQCLRQLAHLFEVQPRRLLAELRRAPSSNGEVWRHCFSSPKSARARPPRATTPRPTASAGHRKRTKRVGAAAVRGSGRATARETSPPVEPPTDP